MAERDRVESKLGTVETYLRGLEEKQDCPEDKYLRDRDVQDIVERRFHKAIQCCLDIASHIVAAEGFREPDDYGDLFRVLEEEGVLASNTAGKMVEMAGFRNVLAMNTPTLSTNGCTRISKTLSGSVSSHRKLTNSSTTDVLSDPYRGHHQFDRPQYRADRI